MARNIAVETELGVIRGRDTFFLERVVVERDTLVLEGELVGSHCGAVQADQDFRFSLSFRGVLALTMTELDSWEEQAASLESSFDEVEDSGWVQGLGGKVTPQHRHFVVLTYDDVFEIVCMLYELQIEKVSA